MALSLTESGKPTEQVFAVTLVTTGFALFTRSVIKNTLFSSQCHYVSTSNLTFKQCTCTATGVLIVPPAVTGGSGTAADGLDSFLYDALCDFACSRGYCPDGVCTASDTSSSSSSQNGTSGSGDFLVYPDSDIWDDSKSLIPLFPPCTLVLPPYTLSELTTISFEPYTTSLDIVTITTTTIITYTNTAAGTTYVSTVPVGDTSTTTTTVIVPPRTSSSLELSFTVCKQISDKLANFEMLKSCAQRYSLLGHPHRRPHRYNRYHSYHKKHLATYCNHH